MRITYLQITFILANGSKYSLNIPNADELLEKTEIKEKMDRMVELDVITKDDASLGSPFSARYITRTVKDIFVEKN